jgi:transposase
MPAPCAPIPFGGSTDASEYRAYVDQVLVKSPQPGDVVVMDNLAPHKVAGIKESVERAGAKVRYLLPYSPDIDPNEKIWSKVKTRLRFRTTRTFETLISAIGHALICVPPHHCRYYFHGCQDAT